MRRLSVTEKRERALAALVQWVDEGVVPTSWEIAVRAGVSQPSLFKEFGSLNGLYEAAISVSQLGMVGRLRYAQDHRYVPGGVRRVIPAAGQLTDDGRIRMDVL